MKDHRDLHRVDRRQRQMCIRDRSDYYTGIFQERAHRNTAENTVNHRGGGVGSVVANHRSGGGNSVTVTRLHCIIAHGGDNSKKLVNQPIIWA